MNQQRPKPLSASMSTGRMPDGASPLAQGSLVDGRYRIDRLLGVGGMGAVYEATQVAIGRKVALKVIRGDVADDPVVAMRFEREARAASHVVHPNVVTVFDFGRSDDGTLFLVMEFVPGETLRARLKREKKLPMRDGVQVAIDMLAALEVAHDAGVVHRDLKPDNVLLTPQGSVKVLDFGIARIMEREGQPGSPAQSGEPLTEFGQYLGTPRYMSPESVAQKPVGPPADIYALGAILYEMILGESVFPPSEPVIMMSMHLKKVPSRLREKAADVPFDLDRLVAQTLEKEADKRPTATEFKKALQNIEWQRRQSKAPSLAPPPSPLRNAAAASASPMEMKPLDARPIDIGLAQASQALVFSPAPSEKLESMRPKKKSALLSALEWIPFLLVLGGAIYAAYHFRAYLNFDSIAPATPTENATPQTTPNPEVVADPTNVEARRPKVAIRVQTRPANATVEWDNEIKRNHNFEVDQDERAHLLTIRANGYGTQNVDVIPNQSREFNVELRRR